MRHQFFSTNFWNSLTDATPPTSSQLAQALVIIQAQASLSLIPMTRAQCIACLSASMPGSSDFLGSIVDTLSAQGSINVQA